MDIVGYIFSSENLEVLFKLLLSAILSGIIGIQRSSLSKPAGFGTHAIIGISSALVVIGSQYMSIHYNIDASRIPSQIIAGIGFIGAGTIIRNGFNVKGVTTAAAILSVTCIGITVGMGYYIPSIFTTVIVFLILYINHSVRVERIEGLELVLVVQNMRKAIDEVEDFFKKEHIVIESIRKDNDVIIDKKYNVLRISISFDVRKINKNTIISFLASIENVIEVNIEE